MCFIENLTLDAAYMFYYSHVNFKALLTFIMNRAFILKLGYDVMWLNCICCFSTEERLMF